MALTSEIINFNDALFSKLKELYTTLITEENNSSGEKICVRLEIKEKDVEPFVDNFSSMSNF